MTRRNRVEHTVMPPEWVSWEAPLRTLGAGLCGCER